ncbi:MAG: iron-containing alcohol dehydrogenase [Polyangiaceae bacterium]
MLTNIIRWTSSSRRCSASNHKPSTRIGKYLRLSEFTEVAILWGEGLKDRFGATIGVSLDATDVSVAFEAVAQSHDIETLFRLSLRIPPRVKAIVAVGGGRAIDCAKYIGHLLQKPVVVVPTAISNDGFCSPFSSLLVEGNRRTVRTVLPEGIRARHRNPEGLPRTLALFGDRGSLLQVHGHLRLEARLRETPRTRQRFRRGDGSQ